MSIENNIERIAIALEKIASYMDNSSNVAVNDEKPVAKPPAVPSAPKVAAPAQAPVASPPVAPPSEPVVEMTPDELNKALVTEFNRLGDRAPIDKIMREQFGCQSITELDSSKYHELIKMVKMV